jgi:hypothetical protein
VLLKCHDDILHRASRWDREGKTSSAVALNVLASPCCAVLGMPSSRNPTTSVID